MVFVGLIYFAPLVLDLFLICPHSPTGYVNYYRTFGAQTQARNPRLN